MQSIHTDFAVGGKPSAPSELHQSPRLAQPCLYCTESLCKYWIYTEGDRKQQHSGTCKQNLSHYV